MTVESHSKKLENITGKISESLLIEKIRTYNLLGCLNYFNSDVEKSEEYFTKAQSSIQSFINFKNDKVVSGNIQIIDFETFNNNILEKFDANLCHQ